MSYHLVEIEKGIYGEFSKIREEFQEAQDASAQNNKILLLNELTDLYGAVEEFVKREYNLTMQDVADMSDATKRAFSSGRRVSEQPTNKINIKLPEPISELIRSDDSETYEAYVKDSIQELSNKSDLYQALQCFEQFATSDKYNNLFRAVIHNFRNQFNNDMNIIRNIRDVFIDEIANYNKTYNDVIVIFIRLIYPHTIATSDTYIIFNDMMNDELCQTDIHHITFKYSKNSNYVHETMVKMLDSAQMFHNKCNNDKTPFNTKTLLEWFKEKEK